ncbi:metalloregulator ArsR/SmtB family transcription factor [Acidimicrobiaceae bacterium USS-CC1]|uniref:Metalloregulator ArsR/SmtB family transcription factor n=1 Tax=Acidiferrimicrobium australe TaxID=2664430 RepID=A0ABW9QP32_9ACTN|nr:metalloregulator ArsR/SmtB family transcription factor [Acidiferrimicrobium australe]
MQQRAGIESGGELRLRLQLDELVSTMCKALNDPKRLMLLYSLRDGQRTVGELCQMLGAPQSNTSQHLAILRERGLVSTERRGSSVLYSLRYPELLDAVDLLRGIMSAEVDRQLQLRSLAPPEPVQRRSPPGPRGAGRLQPG